MSQILSEIKGSMYEYEVITAHQLGVIHSYNWERKSIYPLISRLNKKQEVRKIDVQQLGRGSKAYYLTPKAAKQVAEARQEIHLFKERDWETVPGSVINILMANQFFTELIRATREIPESGLTDWIGRRTLAHRYFNDLDGEKDAKQRPRMNGYGVIHLEGRKRHIHLDVFTGNETDPVIQDKLENHIISIMEYWQDTGETKNTLLLLLYLGRRTGERLNKIIKTITPEFGDEVPFVAIAPFENLATEGIFSSQWVNVEKDYKLSLLDMPYRISERPEIDEMIGKQKKIELQFKVINGFQLPSIKKKEQSDKSSSSEKTKIAKPKETKEKDNQVVPPRNVVNDGIATHEEIVSKEEKTKQDIQDEQELFGWLSEKGE